MDGWEGLEGGRYILSIELFVKLAGWFHSTTALCASIKTKPMMKNKIIIGTVFEWKKHKCSKDHIRLHILQYITLLYASFDSSKDVSRSYNTIGIRSFVRLFQSIGFCSVVQFISWSTVRKMYERACACVYVCMYTILNVLLSCLVLSYVACECRIIELRYIPIGLPRSRAEEVVNEKRIVINDVHT